MPGFINLPLREATGGKQNAAIALLLSVFKAGQPPCYLLWPAARFLSVITVSQKELIATEDLSLPSMAKLLCKMLRF